MDLKIIKAVGIIMKINISIFVGAFSPIQLLTAKPHLVAILAYQVEPQRLRGSSQEAYVTIANTKILFLPSWLQEVSPKYDNTSL